MGMCLIRVTRRIIKEDDYVKRPTKASLKKAPVKAPGPILTPAQQAAQDWLPIRDLHDGCLFRPDGGVIAGVTLPPFSLSLKSHREVANLIAGLQSALNSLDVPWQILSIGRPVELDSYLQSLDAMLPDATADRKPLLREYLHWVSGLVRSGETTERRYYLLMSRTGSDAVAEHRSALRDVLDALSRIDPGFQCLAMTDADCRELLFLAFHADQSAVENVPEGRVGLPPIYQGGI
jgi:hypothetical protein